MRRLLWRQCPGTLPRDSLAARDRTLLAVACVAGLRVSEPAALRLDDLGWGEQRGLYSVLIVATKRGRGDIHTPDGEMARLWRQKSPLKGPRGERTDMQKVARELAVGLRGVLG